MMHGSAPTLDNLHTQLIDLASKTLPDGRPAFLFRGESGIYPNTFTSLDRHYHNQELEEGVHDELDALTAFCMRTPLRSGRLPAKLAGAFAQHYGLPTQVFDFTASPGVAINFAANRALSRWPPSKFGMMGILDVAKAEESRRVALFDLRRFPDALRAQRQAAFGLIYAGFVEDDRADLKRTVIAEQIGLSWNVFAHLPDDETYLFLTGNDANLEDLTDDPAAEIPQEMIDLYVLVHGAMSRAAAKLLVRVVPFAGRSPAENLLRWSDGR